MKPVGWDKKSDKEYVCRFDPKSHAVLKRTILKNDIHVWVGRIYNGEKLMFEDHYVHMGRCVARMVEIMREHPTGYNKTIYKVEYNKDLYPDQKDYEIDCKSLFLNDTSLPSGVLIPVLSLKNGQEYRLYGAGGWELVISRLSGPYKGKGVANKYNHIRRWHRNKVTDKE